MRQKETRRNPMKQRETRQKETRRNPMRQNPMKQNPMKQKETRQNETAESCLINNLDVHWFIPLSGWYPILPHQTAIRFLRFNQSRGVRTPTHEYTTASIDYRITAVDEYSVKAIYVQQPRQKTPKSLVKRTGRKAG